MRLTEEEYQRLMSRHGVTAPERTALQQAISEANAKIPPPTEDVEQQALVNWLRWKGHRFNATPNGGQRFKKTAARLKMTGVVPGVPDLTVWPPIGSRLPIVYIELKRQRGGQISAYQREWIDYLTQISESHNIQATVCKGCDEAIKFLQAQGY